MQNKFWKRTAAGGLAVSGVALGAALTVTMILGPASAEAAAIDSPNGPLAFDDTKSILISGWLRGYAEADAAPHNPVEDEVSFVFDKACPLSETGGSCTSTVPQWHTAPPTAVAIRDVGVLRAEAHAPIGGQIYGRGTSTVLRAGIVLDGSVEVKAYDRGPGGCDGQPDSSTANGIALVQSGVGVEAPAVFIPFEVTEAATMSGIISIQVGDGTCDEGTSEVFGVWEIIRLDGSQGSFSGSFTFNKFGEKSVTLHEQLPPGLYSFGLRLESEHLLAEGASDCHFEGLGDYVHEICGVKTTLITSLGFQSTFGN